MDNHKKNKTAPLLVSVETLANRYGLSGKTIRKWGHDGLFPMVKLSAKCIRFPLAECDAAIEKRRVLSTSEIESAKN